MGWKAVRRVCDRFLSVADVRAASLWLVTGYTDFYSWVWESLYAPHGPVHTWIGGVLNCEDTVSSVSDLVGQDNADSLALYAFDQRKNFWRDEYFECQGSAATVSESADKVCECGGCVCGCGCWCWCVSVFLFSAETELVG